jgi:PD-(D/E)XK nuclease superfamily
MDRAAYLAALRGFADRLGEPKAEPDPERAAYVARLVALAAKLQESSEQQLDDGSDAFRRILRPNVRDIMWRVAGATLERRRRLAPEARDSLRVLETSPDLLGPLAYSRTEVAHSRALCFLLDPSRSGELGHECLRAFVELVMDARNDNDAEDQDADVSGSTVEAERAIHPWGRVDISIESPSSLIFVEVKVDAEERPNQLLDYSRALAHCAGTRQAILVFLTANEQQAGVGTKHRHVTFRDLLRAWLPIAARTRRPEGTYLAMYLKTIARHLERLADEGEFDHWRLRTQRAALAFIEKEVETDA